MAAVRCWHCSAPAAHASLSIGAALCSVRCRDATARLAPTRIGADTQAARALALAAPSLAGAGGRWRAADDSGMVVVPAHVAARLQRIGPNTKRGLGADEPAAEPDAKRQAPSEPLAVPGEYGFLDLMVRDIRREVVQYLSLKDLAPLVPTLPVAHAELARRLTELVDEGVYPLQRYNLTILDMVDVMAAAASVNDRGAFNSAAQIAIIEYLRQVRFSDPPSDELYEFASLPGERKLSGWVVAKRYVDYALLCSRDTIRALLFAWHLRRHYSAVPGLLGAPGRGGIDLRELHAKPPFSINFLCLEFVYNLAQVHCLERWYNRVYRPGNPYSRAFMDTITYVYESVAKAMIRERIHPQSTIGAELDDLSTPAYRDNIAQVLPTLALGVYSKQSDTFRLMNNALTRSRSILMFLGWEHEALFASINVERVFPHAGLDDEGAGIAEMPAAITFPAKADAILASAAAAAVTSSSSSSSASSSLSAP